MGRVYIAPQVGNPVELGGVGGFPVRHATFMLKLSITRPLVLNYGLHCYMKAANHFLPALDHGNSHYIPTTIPILDSLSNRSGR